MSSGAAPIISFLADLPEPSLILDTRTDSVLAWNPAAATLLGGAPDHPAPARFSPFAGASLPRFIVFIEEVDHRGEAWTRDIDLIPVAGDTLRCEIRGRQLREHPGCILLLLTDLEAFGTRTAITETAEMHRAGLIEWKRAERFFTELERENQLILNAAGEGIYGVNAEGKTTFVNRAAREMLGWTTEDLLGRNIHALIHHHHLNGESYPAHECKIYQSFRFEQVNRIDNEVFWRKDGKPIRVEYVSTPIYDQQVLVGAVVIFRDITERKENERKLHDALKEVASLRDKLEQENAYLQEAITSERAHHDIVGTSSAIKQVRARIDLVAPTDATVLITGETGTGKALVANAIHKASARSRRAMIYFKCGAISTDEVETELFGQVRGAFPGSIRDKPGKLELAHGGTLFLDDISELPFETQGRLLQTLQTGSVTRLGDTRAKALDLHVIAAMTDTPENAVKSGKLREDLLFFLNVFPISCAPLRDRPEDIPLLASHLLEVTCRRLNLSQPIITERAVQQMMEYRWPGNVRELRNVVERAAIVSGGGKIILELGTSPGAARSDAVQIRTQAEIDSMIRNNLVACLRETGGKVSGSGGAAELLGVQPTTLYSRIRRFQIDPSEWDIPNRLQHEGAPSEKTGGGPRWRHPTQIT
ncbi:PAS domain S-box-containing protein [Roseovarius pacificus]|uniref:Nif-specific regulatory protein n=2 Tax=Roseovarius pacificus TaxID=337701 RepID=A0A1M7AAP3_9RHOB|nr:sigma 54-interacting transcriptional regulator [Roseovarius pacificus]GGO53677.1 transcriptional regulator [Roseovarius pacificus]SHL39803.1 PAS domain S-box-containing protein [Roseovarius pacificus]